MHHLARRRRCRERRHRRDGTLPWRISSDLKTFRRLTMGKPLIMGRRTFQSLKKPLDGRDNIVVTTRPRLRAGRRDRRRTTSHDALTLARSLRRRAGRRRDRRHRRRDGVPRRRCRSPTASTDGGARAARRATRSFRPSTGANGPEVSREALPRGAKDDFTATLQSCSSAAKVKIAVHRSPLRLNGAPETPNLMQRVCAAGTPCPISETPTFPPRTKRTESQRPGDASAAVGGTP